MAITEKRVVNLQTQLNGAVWGSRLSRADFCCVGDSGFFLLRAGRLDGQVELLHRSREQQHYFNCPYQIGSGCDDTPDDASIEEFEVRAGDILLLATGAGLFLAPRSS